MMGLCVGVEVECQTFHMSIVCLFSWGMEDLSCDAHR